jgi:hypothetical protein
MPRIVGSSEELQGYYTLPGLEPAPEHDGGPLTMTDKLRIGAAIGDFDQLSGKLAFGGVEHELEVFVSAEPGKAADHEAALAQVALATSCAVFIDRVNLADPVY